MKTIRLKYSILAAFSAVALTALVGATNAGAQLIINQFDASTEISQWGAGGGSSVVWDGAMDAGGNASIGSMYITCPYTSQGNNWQEFQITKYVNNSPIDLTSLINLEFDIKVDTTNSFTSLDGNYGWVRIVIQGGSGWAWQPFGQTSITNRGTGWQHVKCSLAGLVSPAQTVIFDFDTADSAYPTNTIRYWVDNVVFTSPPLPPPTLANLTPAPKQAGLTLLPTAGQYERVMVYPAPLGSGFGWYGAGVPVSYSFTITNFPTLDDYSAQFFLIPNVTSIGINNASPDWGCTNGLFFTITANASNPAQVWYISMAAKTNATASNPNLTITNYNYNSLPIGTWTITFNNNTDFTITAPDNSVVSASLPPDVAQLVSGNASGNTALTPYFGIMPRMNSNIGTPAVFSHIKITQGATVLVNDNFNLGVLDTNATWSTLGVYGADVTVNSGDLAYYLSWNTPNDQGYSSLIAASKLTGPWQDFADSPSWLFVNAKHEVPITKSALQSKLGGTDAAFFRLVKREFTQLQVLLPGETNAPNTLTGKTGTPIAQANSTSFDVTINAVDNNWNIVNSGDQIALSNPDPNFSIFSSPTQPNLSGGTVTMQVIFLGDGSSQITATDVTDNTKTPGTSSTVTY